MVNYIPRMVFFIGLALAASYLCVNPTSLHAQTVSGTILGTIQDQQGAVIPNAEVSTRSLDTGAIRKTNADASGNYRVSSVPAGSYEVSATASGFKTEVRTGVIVTVGGDSSVNFALTIGAITEKVEVSEAAVQVDTASSTLGGFVSSATIRELPLNGRDWLQLALLQPGVYMNTGQAQNDANRAQKGNGLAFSISGARQSDNGYRIDGLIVNDYANAGPGSSLRVNMGVDAIREFSVLTNSFSAEYGRGSGVVNAITKSGTNEFHGSAFYFHRNSALDARNFFDNVIPAFRRHQYGGALGGPIKKDKTFFFTNYESLHETKGLSSSVDTISANAHNGLVCANTACTSTNQITVAPSVKPYLAFFPLPNGPVTGNTGKFLFGAPRLGEEDYVIGKIDHSFSSATTLSGSFVDDVSFIKSMYTTQFNHGPAQVFQMTGHQIPARPSFGAWLSYGIGSEGKDLPAYVVMLSGVTNPDGGAACWECGFLPTVYQGIPFQKTGDPINFVSNPAGVTPEMRRNSLDVIGKMNHEEMEADRDPEISTRIAAYEMAYKMQTSVPGLMDVASEPASIHEMYGTTPGRPSYANNCLLARRLVERGVRFVQLAHRNWDMHGSNYNEDVINKTPQVCRETDRGSSALIKDLKQRGLPDSTLIIWAGEFGRTPMRQPGPFLGRDHHPKGYTVWMAGGGIQPGISYGQTDEFGYNAVVDRTSVHDLNATALRLLGIDHKKLTFRFQGRDFRLTDVEGEPIKRMIA